MNALQRFGAAVGSGIERIRAGTMRFTARTSYGIQAILGRTSINYRASVGSGAGNSIVVAVVGWVARNFPEAPVRIRRLALDGTAEVIPPGPTGPGYMLRLLERPNRYFSGVLQWMATIVDLYTTGNAYWLKIRTAEGRVQELWWVPSWMIKPAWPDDGSVFISHYLYRIDGRDYGVEFDDVVHYRDGLDPSNPRLGLSKLASLFREIYTDDEAANFTAALLTNLGVPGVVLAPANTATATVRGDPEAIKTAYMEKFGGDRRGEPLVLTSPTDVKVLSWSPDDMNLEKMRRVPEERVSAVFGISAIVAQLGAGLDRSTFTNFGEARLAAYQESIVSLQRLIAAELEVQLLDEFADLDRDNLDVDFDISKASAMQPLLDALWKRLESAATKGLITRGTFKQGVGLPVTPADDVYIRPNNFMELTAGQDPAIAASTARPVGPRLPPGNPAEPARALGPGAQQLGAELRCEKCDKLLAERATPPYRLTCARCNTVAEAELELAVELEAAAA